MYMGIDPGVGGGIVLLDEKGAIALIRKMPETLTDMNDFFNEVTWEHKIDKCVIELVHARPTDTPVVAFALGQNYGQLSSFMTVYKVPYETVSPQKWQKYYNMKRDGKAESTSSWKNRLRDLATRMFGLTSKEIILQVADAALIARYCYNLYGRKEGNVF